MFETLSIPNEPDVRLHPASIRPHEFSDGIALTLSAGGPKQDLLSAYLDWFSSQQPVPLSEPLASDDTTTCKAAVIPFPSVRANRGLPFG